MAPNAAPATSKLIIGCGYLGTRVAERWLAAGHEVWAMTRSEPRAAEFAHQGLRPIVADVLVPESLSRLPAVQSVLYAVGYDRTAGRSIEQVYVNGLRHVLEALPGGVERFIYISSTGVYGMPKANGSTSKHLAIRNGPAARPVWPPKNCWTRAVGNGRPSAWHGRHLRAGPHSAAKPCWPASQSLPPAEGYLNLIQVHDAATVVLAADERAQPPRLYCVSDGHPAVRREYYECLARLASAPPPQFKRRQPTRPPRNGPRPIAAWLTLDCWRSWACNLSFRRSARGCGPFFKRKAGKQKRKAERGKRTGPELDCFSFPLFVGRLVGGGPCP